MRSGPGPHFLVGFMGCGKTSVGERLAEILGRPFVDSDTEIERREGQSVAAIFADAGEAHFRKVESELLGELVDGSAVVATGGGAFLRSATRQALRRRGCTVWLDASFESCLLRIGEGKDRPLWPAGDRLAQRALFDRRRAAYALARLRIAADDPPELVAQRLARLLQDEKS